MTPVPPPSVEQLAQWKQLAREATPGPWLTCEVSADDSELGTRHSNEGIPHIDLYREVYKLAAADGTVWVNFNEPPNGAVNVACLVDPSPADVAFIAAARTAIPLLVSEVERLRALLAKQT